MFHVVSLEGCSGRNAHGEVGKDQGDLVVGELLGSQIVAGLVHGKRHGMVDCATESVATEEPYIPRFSLQQVQRGDLYKEGEEDLVDCCRVVTHELGNIRVRGLNVLPPVKKG